MGSTTIFGFKKHTNTWGTGLAATVGAGDGIVVDSDGLAYDVSLIDNKGLSGQGTKSPGTLGDKIVSLSPVCPLYYRGPDLAIAMAFGSLVAPVQQGATAAWLHGMRMASSRSGLYGTGVTGGANHPVVREFPHLKINGFTLDAKRNDLVRVTLPMPGYDMNLCPADDDDRVVASVKPVNGALVIAAQPVYPSPITVTVTDINDSITEMIITFVGEDENGWYATETYTLSVDTKTWTSDTRFSSITSATVSGVAGVVDDGVDFVKVGVANLNDTTSYQSISFPATADYKLVSFGQMHVYLNAQSGADFTSSDEIFVDSLQIKMDPTLRTDKVTTKHHNRIEEPTENGFAVVTCSLAFPQWDAANSLHVRSRMLASASKMKVVFSGPIAAAPYPLQWQFFANNIQFTGGTPSAGGPEQIPLQMEGEAHQASANPTGLPAWADTQPLSAAVTNLRAVAMWA